MTLYVGFKAAEDVVGTNLPERLKTAGFSLLSHKDLGDVVSKADGRIEQLAQWTHKLDVTHWALFFACQIPVLAVVWYMHTLTVGFVLAQTAAAAAVSIVVQVVMRNLTLRRARKSFHDVFGWAYKPSIDQIKRVQSVSKWMAAIGQLVLEDGRTVVAISAPALKTTLFVVDGYRK